MTTKNNVISELGEQEVLLPGLISAALAANDRIKARLSLLQDVAAQARSTLTDPIKLPLASGIEAEIPEAALANVRLLGPQSLYLPAAGALLGGLRQDLDVMLAPLLTASPTLSAEYGKQVAAIETALQAEAPDQISLSHIATLTSAARDGTPKFHVLVMDLHKAINHLAARTAPETLAGAQVHGLNDDERDAVRAFMGGLDSSAPLAFGHPGLGTTAVHGTGDLVIQNDIGTTDAHVVVVHVSKDTITVTYTDLHLERASFFMALFEDQMVVWSQLKQHQTTVLEEDHFYLVTGRFNFTHQDARNKFLTFLASRLVFLIDWNKARKALQPFVGKKAAIELLGWAATCHYGHRAFLELGGERLVYGAIQRAASGRIRYGERLDAALGKAESQTFLRHVLRETSLGLTAGRGMRLILDQVQAELARSFETAEATVFTMIIRQLGLARDLAEGLEIEIIARGSSFVSRARHMETKGDRLTIEARERTARIQNASGLRLIIDAIEEVTDGLEDGAYLISLAPVSEGLDGDLLTPLAGMVTQAISAMVRAVEATSRSPDVQRTDSILALQAIDDVLGAEHDADFAHRKILTVLFSRACTDARNMILALELAKVFERATDHMLHAALALRDRILEKLSV